MAKKLICMLLALIMLTTVSVSCNKSSGGKPEGLYIVDEGQSEYVIVRGENASPSEVTAATELQSYLKKISGVELPIVTDTTAIAEKEIVVGKTSREKDGDFNREELGDDGFVIRVADNTLWLVGGEQRGTLYSVYEFLEAYLGCRFYTETVEKVPEMNTVFLDKNTPEDKQIPAFYYRETYGSSDASFVSKLRLNGTINTPDVNYGDRIHGSRNHNLFNLIDPDIYYEEHPEYFSGPGYTQPCLTNPEVIQIVIESCRKYLTENPKVTLMSLCQEDSIGQFCKCDECNRVLEEEGGFMAGVLVRFANAVATALKDEFPKVKFVTFAYYETQYCPTKTKVADNVIIMYCTMAGCYSHSLEECLTKDCRPSASIYFGNHAENIVAWSEFTENILVWDYTTNFHNYNAYVANFTVMLDNLRFLADHNTVGVFEQACSTETTDFKELRRYIIAKILWDPYMSEEEYWGYIDDFLQNYYGPGWKHIRDYIDYTEELVSDICYCLYEDPSSESLYFPITIVEKNPIGTYDPSLTPNMIRNYKDVDWRKYYNWNCDIENRLYLDKGEACFAAALAEAETDEQRARIEKASLQVEYVESYYRYLQLNGGMGFYEMISAYMDANADQFTKNEMSTLYKLRLVDYAVLQVEKDYVEFNKALHAKLVANGIVQTREGAGYINEVNKVDFSKTPMFWR